jgi:hypothetical protein
VREEKETWDGKDNLPCWRGRQDTWSRGPHCNRLCGLESCCRLVGHGFRPGVKERDRTPWSKLCEIYKAWSCFLVVGCGFLDMQEFWYRSEVVFSKSSWYGRCRKVNFSILVCICGQTMDCFKECVDIVYLFRHKGIKDIETLR